MFLPWDYGELQSLADHDASNNGCNHILHNPIIRLQIKQEQLKGWKRASPCSRTRDQQIKTPTSLYGTLNYVCKTYWTLAILTSHISTFRINQIVLENGKRFFYTFKRKLQIVLCVTGASFMTWVKKSRYNHFFDFLKLLN